MYFIDGLQQLQIQQEDQHGVQKSDAIDRDTDWPQFVPSFRDFRLVPSKNPSDEQVCVERSRERKDSVEIEVMNE